MSEVTRTYIRPFEARVPGFEITDLASLHQRMRHGPDAGHRIDFHTITLITEGTTDRAVDFVSYLCRPGTLLWVRPGQVQRFGASNASNGVHLLFTSAFPALVRPSRLAAAY